MPGKPQPQAGAINKSIHGFRIDAIWAASTALIALAAAVWSLRFWDWRPGLPLSLQGDAPFVGMQLRDLADHGWYWFNSDLGYPYGQSGFSFPELNVLHLALVKTLGLFFADPFSPGVVYFLLGFPLAALAMYFLCRTQGMGSHASLVAAVLFGNAPGHQERFQHLWLASYWVLPLGLWIVLRILEGRALVGSAEGATGMRRWIHPQTVASFLVLAAVALSGIYYAAFVLILLLVSAVFRRWGGGRMGDWIPGLGAMGCVIIILMLPLLAAKSGAAGIISSDASATSRTFVHSELFAGKLMDLVLPWAGHRLDAMAHLNKLYNSAGPTTVENSAIGVVALAGCVGLGIVVLRSLLTDGRVARVLLRWGALALVAFSFYTIGGLGSFTALFITPQVRTWSRLFIVIMLFGLLAVGYWMTRISERKGPHLSSCICIGLLALGLFDQTNQERSPNYAMIAQQWSGLQQYTRDLARSIPAECAVLQLPIVQFPEAADANGMKGYEQLLPYLATDGLRWSFGAIRGTAAAEWQQAVNLKDIDRLAKELAAAGFCAIEVNSRGFNELTDPRARLTAALGPPVARTPDSVFVAFKLPPAPARSEAFRAGLLEPVVVRVDGYEIGLERGEARQPVGPTTKLRVVNLGHESVPILVSMQVSGEGTYARVLEIADGAGSVLTRKEVPSSEHALISVSVIAAPGTTTYDMALTGPVVRRANIAVAGEISKLAASTQAKVRVVSSHDQAIEGLVFP